MTESDAMLAELQAEFSALIEEALEAGMTDADRDKLALWLKNEAQEMLDWIPF